MWTCLTISRAAIGDKARRAGNPEVPVKPAPHRNMIDDH